MSDSDHDDYCEDCCGDGWCSCDRVEFSIQPSEALPKGTAVFSVLGKAFAVTSIKPEGDGSAPLRGGFEFL